MSTLTNSIVRGFGLTLGRHAADASISFMNRKLKDSIDYDYVENDIHIEFDNRKYSPLMWFFHIFGLLFISVIPVIGTLILIISIFTTMKPKYLHFYRMEIKTFRISDLRYKTGYREIQKLVPVYLRSEIDGTNPIKTKISLICFSLLISFYVSYQYVSFIVNQ